MYDQYGFYSENGFAGRGAGRRAAGSSAAEHGFRRVRFLRFFAERGRARPPAAAGAPSGAGGGGFRDIFSPVLRRRRRRRRKLSPKRAATSNTS